MKKVSNNTDMTILNKESRATLIQVVRTLSEQQKIVEQMSEAGSEDMSYSEIANALSLRRDVVVDYAIANNL